MVYVCVCVPSLYIQNLLVVLFLIQMIQSLSRAASSACLAAAFRSSRSFACGDPVEWSQEIRDGMGEELWPWQPWHRTFLLNIPTEASLLSHGHVMLRFTRHLSNFPQLQLFQLNSYEGRKKWFSTQQNRSDNRCRSCPQSWSAFCLSFCARSLWFFSMFSCECRITSSLK